ncbi:MAG: hypothetical protein LUC16_04025 [Coprobacillus sp.]|nr:hypothetical protein [Coprobacillus sp.]
MIQTRDLIISLVDIIHPKHLYITVGNHEARMGRFLANALGPEVMGVMPDTPLDLIMKDGFRKRDRMLHTETWYDPLMPILEDHGIDTHFDGGWYCKVGHTIFAHPLTYSSAMLKTTEKAVNYFLRVDRDFNAMVLGHTHKMGSYIQGGISMFEQGCCCDLSKLDYADGKLIISGQEGYLYLCHDKDGDIIQDHTRMVQL